MAYLDTHRPSVAAQGIRYFRGARFGRPYPASADRLAPDRPFRAQARDLRQMLVAAVLAAATILVVAAALLVRS